VRCGNYLLACRAEVRTTNPIVWVWLCGLALAASCAQGSTDTQLPEGADAGGSSGIAGGGVEAGVPTPSNEDAGGGAINPNGSGGEDATAGDDTGGGSGSGGSGSGSGGSSSGSGSGSGGSGSGSGGSGSGSGSGSGGSTVPTTCAQADTTYGCCVGNTVYYCKSGTNVITPKVCSGSEVCGWDSAQSYYYCVSGSGGSDPSGTYPIVCK